jgi:hypothetical protein
MSLLFWCCLQSTLVDFPYLRDVWRANTSEERLLGVSLTGIMDNTLMSGQQGMSQLNDTLQQLKEHAVQVRMRVLLLLLLCLLLGSLQITAVLLLASACLCMLTPLSLCILCICPCA